MANQVHVFPLSLHDAARGLAQVAKDIGSGQQIQLQVNSGLGVLNVSASRSGEEIESDGALVTFLKACAKQPFLQCTSASLHTMNPVQGKNFRISYSNSNGVAAFFQLDDMGSSVVAFAAGESLNRHFKLMTYPAVLLASLPEQERTALKIREQTTGELQAAVTQLGVFLTDMARKNAELIQEMTTDLQNRFNAKQTELDAAIRKQQELIDDDRRKFSQEKAAFDDRASTHVRRDLLTKIQENIKLRTQAKPKDEGRLLVHIVGWIFIIVGLGGMAFAADKIFDIAKSGTLDWKILPPFTAAAVLFACTLIFYIRWISRWADRLSHYDVATAQYATDILRASWIAELLFEYKDEQGRKLPTEVLSSLTEGLFKREQFINPKYHPADDLIAAIGKIKSVKVGADGVELAKG